MFSFSLNHRFVIFSHESVSFMEVRTWSRPLLYPWYLKQYLAHNRCSINNEWMQIQRHQILILVCSGHFKCIHTIRSSNVRSSMVKEETHKEGQGQTMKNLWTQLTSLGLISYRLVSPTGPPGAMQVRQTWHIQAASILLNSNSPETVLYEHTHMSTAQYVKETSPHPAVLPGSWGYLSHWTSATAEYWWRTLRRTAASPRAAVFKSGIF